MNKPFRRLLAAVIAALAVAVSLSAFQAPSRFVDPKDRVIVVISIDGFPGWEWQDPRLPVPNLWKLASEGVKAKTVTGTNPTVTWPSHTSMITGVRAAKHGVLFNGLPVRGGDNAPLTIKPWHQKEDLVQAPTAYDVIFNAGFTTAEVDWVAIHKAKTITWSFPEVPNPAGAIEREMIAAETISERDVREFFKSSPAWRDYYWTQAAVHILKQHKPNLLLFHLLNTDAANHMFGPKSWASSSAYAYADECVAKIVAALKTSGLYDRATILVVTDHGFKAAKSFVKPNAILQRLGLLRVEDGKTICDAYALGSGGSTMIYFTNPAKKQELGPRLAQVFRETEGVDRVLTPADFGKSDMPDPASNSRMADLMLFAKNGYAFAGGHTVPEIAGTGGGYPGHHGYFATDPDMYLTFIAWGYGIRAGASLEKMSHLDVAPTLAALLGLEMKNVEGRVLKEILVPEQVRSR